MVDVERAPEFLGNLSAFPDGIFGSVDEIEALAEFSMNFEDELLVNIDTELENEMNDLEKKYGATDSVNTRSVKF